MSLPDAAPTLTHQQPCAVWVGSLARQALVLVSRGLTELQPDCVRSSCCSPTTSAPAAAPRPPGDYIRFSCCSLARLHPLQLLFPDCVSFSLLSRTHAHSIVQSIVSTKVTRHYRSPAPRTSHSPPLRTDRQTFKILMY